jgi:hypothetical protein
MTLRAVDVGAATVNNNDHDGVDGMLAVNEEDVDEGQLNLGEIHMEI